MQNSEETPKVEINAMCRTCHQQSDPNELVDILEGESAYEFPVSMQIKMFTGIDVSPMDAMPKKVCLKCRLQLEKSNLFRNKSRNLEAKMRKHLRIINAGRVSHVFDEDEDESEEYSDSIKIIEDLQQKLGADQNDNCKQQADLELKAKQEQFEEELKSVKAKAQQELEKAEQKVKVIEAKLRENQVQLEEIQDDLEVQRREAKLERENAVAELVEAHEAEIKRITEEAEAKLKQQLADGPPSKRKQSASAPELETITLNGDLVSVAVPVDDTKTYTILETGELELVDFVPYEDGEPEDEKIHPCAACPNKFGDGMLGKFRRIHNGYTYDLCSKACSEWFDVIYDAEILLKDDFTESEYNAWLEENGPVEPYVRPQQPNVSMTRVATTHVPKQPPPPVKQPMQRPRPTLNMMVKQEPGMSSQRPQQQRTTHVAIKQEKDDLAQYVQGNDKFCFTCKKNVGNGGIAAKCEGRVANFCNMTCFKRKAFVRPPETVAVKREMMQSPVQFRPVAVKQEKSGPRFYCERCSLSYTQKFTLKRHFVSAHPGEHFNNKVVAEIRD